MAGQNKLVISENAMNKGSESALTKCLENSNEEAFRILKVSPKKEKKVSKKK